MTLTQRQRDVISMTAMSQPERIIGLKLGISYKTVQDHKRVAAQKLGIDNDTASITRCAISTGIVDLTRGTTKPCLKG